MCDKLLEALSRGERRVCATLRLSSECSGEVLYEIGEDVVGEAQSLADRLEECLGGSRDPLSLFEEDDCGSIVERLLDNPLLYDLVSCILEARRKERAG